jgi:hypothetical protein
MQNESLAAVFPKVVLPYLEQWAERSGFTVLSQLLADDHLHALIARYGDQLIPSAKPRGEAKRGNGKPSNGKPGSGYRSEWTPRQGASHATFDTQESEHSAFEELDSRVEAMEEQLAAQDALLVLLRSKIRPLALALGCCPECVVGVEHCPNCGGQSRVGLFEPDEKLLRTLVVDPLIERGIPLSGGDPQRMRSRRRPQNYPEANKRSKSQNYPETNKRSKS